MNKLLGSAALAAVLLASGAQQALAAPHRGGELVFGRYADSLFLDPVLNDANVDIWILTNLYDTLLQPTADGKSVGPGLATAWKVSDDGRSVTLTLREGVQFADGSPLTAEDVKWSLDRARDPKNGIWNELIGSIDSIDASGSTVTLKLKHADPSIVPALATFNTAILPEKKFMAEPGATDADKAKSFAEHPVGSGPFVLKSWQRGSTMELVKNPHYWAKGEDGQPLPYLDGVRFEIVPDDATRILKLQAGELDAAEFIPYARVAELKADSRLAMELFPSTRVFYGSFNVRPQIGGKDNPLANAKVRQALNYATDKNAIIAIATQNVGKPMDSYMSSATPLHYADGPAYPYDLAKAKQLLSEAGFGERLRGRDDRPGRQCRRDGDRSRPAADVERGRREADPAAARQRDPHRPLPQGRFPDAAGRLDRRHSRPVARSRRTSSTTRTSRRSTRAGRATRPTSCSSRASRRPIPSNAPRSTSGSRRSTWPRRRCCSSMKPPIRLPCSRRSRASSRSRWATTSSSAPTSSRSVARARSGPVAAGAARPDPVPDHRRRLRPGALAAR